jgi:hypothetical protein
MRHEQAGDSHKFSSLSDNLIRRKSQQGACQHFQERHQILCLIFNIQLINHHFTKLGLFIAQRTIGTTMIL